MDIPWGFRGSLTKECGVGLIRHEDESGVIHEANATWSVECHPLLRVRVGVEEDASGGIKLARHESARCGVCDLIIGGTIRPEVEEQVEHVVMEHHVRSFVL